MPSDPAPGRGAAPDPAPGRGPAFDLVVDAVRRDGPIGFDRFMDLALYAPEVGFYEAGGAAGRGRGDFLTSPEVGPLFGAVVARALDTWWEELGRPDPYPVLDVGAGPGTLAVAVRAARPACARALEYHLVERSSAQRARHGDHLDLSGVATGPGAGPRFVSSAVLPAQRIVGVVLANELLDNLPFAVLERAGGAWRAVHVGVEGDRLVEVPVDPEPALVAVADAVVDGSGLPDGARIPVQRRAAAWVDEVRARVARGRVVALDYGAPTAELARREGGWLRTYRGHDRGGSPLDAPGTQDITADVAIDQLPAPTTVRPQAEALAAHGLEELVAEGRRTWRERAHLGDLDALRARSRVSEAEALCDPTGLGAFQVLEWVVG